MFIGVHSTILKGSVIGDNVIIGANSVVSGKVDSNTVYAGNPARKIMNLEDFYRRQKKRTNSSISIIVETLGDVDHEKMWSYLREYYCQFIASPERLRESIMKDSGNIEKCLECNSQNAEKHFLIEFTGE